MDRRYALKAEGMTVSDMAERVVRVMGIASEQVWLPGKYKQEVVARSLLSYWSVHELGECMTALIKRLGISTAAATKAVRRGARIAEDQALTLKR